ncbi:1-Acylglycerol-3-Phosphocholine Acyltransferase [Klebsormidium nitens]|uniref:1-Acylglycerol-3-Phosphocholine Acyltransferase n=1 Tax=Klebsormidium nitens TaxID=105231 RepID=A0A1Y1HS37_KLENI|nr:1-Acylglycerol-3-Phosphocholine Acyltransferase [Klebsormidium nitens]|eukprot:GAQ79386.1 1-Acylglycerol-3-Phosphocholine Acyltransferase [Klebsormidium nitens]
MAPQDAVPHHGLVHLNPTAIQYACFFSCAPLGLIHRFVPTATARHLYSILTAAVMLRILHPEAAPHFAFIIAVSYTVMLLHRRRCGVIVTWVGFAHITWCHWLYRGYYRGSFPFVGSFSVLVLRLGSRLAFNYQDGLLPKDQLTKTQALFRVTSLPSVLEYLGFVSQGYMSTGPHIHLVDYSQFTKREGRWSPNEKAPNPLPATLTALARTAVLGYVTQKTIHVAPVAFIKSSTYHHKYSFWRRLGYQLLVFEHRRLRVYAMWSFFEAAWIISGRGFSGWHDGKPSWAGATNFHFWGVELAEHPAAIWANWDIHTGLWLRYYVYDRLTPRGQKPGILQLAATQAASFVWHGPYLGQALFRTNATLIILSARVLYRYKTRLVERPPALKLPARALMWAYTQLTAGTKEMALFLTVLTFRDIWRAFGSIYYLQVLVPLTILVLGWLFPVEASKKTVPLHAQAARKDAPVDARTSARETTQKKDT